MRRLFACAKEERSEKGKRGREKVGWLQADPGQGGLIERWEYASFLAGSSVRRKVKSTAAKLITINGNIRDRKRIDGIWMSSLG